MALGDIALLTCDEWSRKCAKGQGQRINGKRFVYIPCGEPRGTLGEWIEVQLVD